MKKYIVMCIIAAAGISCGSWKVTTLSPEKMITIPAGKDAGQVLIKTDDIGLKKITARVRVFNSRIYLADNALKRFQVLDFDGDVETIIGSMTYVDLKLDNRTQFKFGDIGIFTVDDDGNIFIQNRISLGPGAGGKHRRNYSLTFLPSYILSFNKKGELIYTLGRGGIPDIPFNNIDSLMVDDNNRLIVISRSINSWSVFRFTNKKRDYYKNLGKINFTEREGKQTYTGKIDNVRVFKNGEEMLISVAYYHGVRIKYIKVYDYSIPDDKIKRTIVQIPDPNNIFYAIVKDSKLYFWNVDNESVRFLITNLNGSIVNNLDLKYKNERNFYARLFINPDGTLYSCDIRKKGISLYRWE